MEILISGFVCSRDCEVEKVTRTVSRLEMENLVELLWKIINVQKWFKLKTWIPPASSNNKQIVSQLIFARRFLA